MYSKEPEPAVTETLSPAVFALGDTRNPSASSDRLYGSHTPIRPTAPSFPLQISGLTEAVIAGSGAQLEEVAALLRLGERDNAERRHNKAREPQRPG